MSRRLLLLLAVMLTALAVPAVARAADGWSWPVPGSPILRYGAAYTDASGRTCTHGGVDIAAPPGTSVSACTAGDVTFAGLVPAGDGDRAYAVTVQTSDGLHVTYLPLASVTVHKGQSVSEGHALGALAGTGDASGGPSHLHLGVKRGSAALDPLTFLGSPTAAPAGSASPAASPAAAPAHAAAHAAVHVQASASPAHAPSTVPAGGSVASPAFSPGTAADPAAALGDSLRSMAQAPPVARVEPVAAPAVLNLKAAGTDVAAARDSLLSVAGKVGLLLLAAGCAWPVMRAARSAGARAVPVPARRGR